jgi:phage I-like protein
MKKTLLAAACSFALEAAQPEYLVLIPEGIFHGIDGRPFDAPHWNLTPECGEQIVAALNQRSIDMVVDYEHATLKAQESGEPAPAAGWLKSGGFQYIQGVGVCSAQFEWTDKASGFISSEEYKYLSPVFLYDKTGDVKQLLHVALTNTPNLDQLPEARLAAAAQDFFVQNSQQQDSEMNEELLERLRWMLNLPISATAEDIIAELNKLTAQIQEATGTTVAANGQNLFDAIAAAGQLKVAANSRATVDPTQYVPMAVYQEAVAKAGNADAVAKAKEMDDLITAACSDGRLTGEATISWYKDQAKTNPDFVKAQIEALPKIAALTQQQTSQVNLAANHQQTPAIDDVQNEVFGLLGVSKEDAEKYGA